MPEHPDPHHRHQYDAEREGVQRVEHIGVEQWPTLGDVIAEAFEWWQQFRGNTQ